MPSEEWMGVEEYMGRLESRIEALEARQTPSVEGVALTTLVAMERHELLVGDQIRELYEHVGVQFQGPGMNYPAAGGAYANVQAKMVELWSWLKKDDSDV